MCHHNPFLDFEFLTCSKYIHMSCIGLQHVYTKDPSREVRFRLFMKYYDNNNCNSFIQTPQPRQSVSSRNNVLPSSVSWFRVSHLGFHVYPYELHRVTTRVYKDPSRKIRFRLFISYSDNNYKSLYKNSSAKTIRRLRVTMCCHYPFLELLCVFLVACTFTLVRRWAAVNSYINTKVKIHVLKE